LLKLGGLLGTGDGNAMMKAACWRLWRLAKFFCGDDKQSDG
jgi:hypothetical protein